MMLVIKKKLKVQSMFFVLNFFSYRD